MGGRGVCVGVRGGGVCVCGGRGGGDDYRGCYDIGEKFDVKFDVTVFDVPVFDVNSSFRTIPFRSFFLLFDSLRNDGHLILY